MAAPGAVAPGAHALLSVELPLYGGASTGGITLRLGARVIVTRDQCFSTDASTVEQCLALDASHKKIVEPGTALQVLAGFVYYL